MSKLKIFKAYDIRGEFSGEFNVDLVYRIGRCLPNLLQARKFLIGRDARKSSPSVRDALCKGLIEAGADVDDMGLCTTPMVYYFTARDGYDASIQITASHNPPSHNGMKISTAGARPVGYANGLAELEQRVQGELPLVAAKSGKLKNIERLTEFISFLRKWVPDLKDLRLGIDCSNGMAALFAKEIFGINALFINEAMDGDFPGHPPNPLDEANCAQLMDLVKRNNLDAGVIFDGDADRVMFIDETGKFIQPDYLIPAIAAPFLRNEKNVLVLHDIRTSRGVIETLHAAGARTSMGRVGHAFAKEKMRQTGAACGGELAGHYYFRDFFCCDSGELAALVILGELARAHAEGLTFSEWIAPIRRYPTTGELNFIVTNKEAALTAVREAFESMEKPLEVFDFDGVRLEFKQGWINVRPSNTEPYLRLILETEKMEILEVWRSIAELALNPFL